MTNKLKKLLSGGFLIMQTFTFQISLAASSPAVFMPANPQFYWQLDTSKEHPFEGQLSALLTEQLNNSDQQIFSKILTSAIDKTVLGISQTENISNHSNIDLIAFQIDENIFNQIISEAKPNQLKTEDLGMNRKIYQEGKKLFFTYKLGNAIFSSSKGIISDILMSEQQNVLSKNMEFQQMITGTPSDNFLIGYIDLERFKQNQAAISNESEKSPVKIEGITLKQDTLGLTGQLYLKFFENLNIHLNNFQFSPSLYQIISAQNLLYFQEYNNLAGQLEMLSKKLSPTDEISGLFEDIKQNISSELGINYQTDLAPLFEGQAAFSVHSDLSNQYLPAFSFISKINSDQKNKAEQLIEKLKTSIQKIAEQQIQEYYDNQISLKNFYNEYYPEEANPYNNLPNLSELKKDLLQISEQNINGTKFIQFALNPQIISQGLSSNIVNQDKFKLQLSIGVSPDNQLIFTTLTNPANLFSTLGLNQDQYFENSLVSGKINGLSYLNFINLQNYLQSVLKDLDLENEISSSINELLNPLHSLTVVSNSNDNALISNIRLNADLQKLPEQFSEIISSFEKLIKPKTEASFNFNQFSRNKFSDIGENDWYNIYINNISDKKIMNGYSNGTFRPNQPITRAEYIKTVISALEYSSQDLNQDQSIRNFKDVQSQDWFYPYLERAQQSGLAKGFDDNTFRPNQPIKRAEAIQILYNASPLLQSGDAANFQMSFNDIKPQDWFYQAVQSASYYNIISGKNNWEFQPNAPLTRAEAAKIIEHFLSL